MTKHWKAVAGFPGYEVSDSGEFQTYLVPRKKRTIDYTVPAKPLRVYPDKRDKGGPKYLRTVLRDPLGKKVSVRVHTEVAKAFIGPRPVGTQICHRDGDLNNNSVTNLYYGSPKQNGEDKIRHGTCIRGEQHPSAKLTTEQVQWARIQKSNGVSGASLARKLNVGKSTMHQLLTQRSWKDVH